MAYTNSAMGQFASAIPDSTEDPNIPGDLNTLANAIEKRVVGIYATNATRDTATAGKAVDGMWCITLDTHTLWYYNVNTWTAFPAGTFKTLSGAGAPAPTTGNNGDIYYQTS